MDVNCFFKSDWCRANEVSVLGTAFVDGAKITKKDFAEYISNVPNSSISKKLAEINGFYSIVYFNGTVAWMAVDRIRSMPLFYGVCGDKLFISDDAYWVKEHVGANAIDHAAKAEFMLTGFVTGDETLYSEVKQMQAGEIVAFSLNSNGGIDIASNSYYQYAYESSFITSENLLVASFDKVMSNSIDRLIDFSNGKAIVLPLSGGYDSRLIALMLKKFNCRNVITFTYGKEGSEEVEISRTVAKALGFPWHFVEYDADKWKAMLESQEWKNFFINSGNLCSLPHIQDFIAIKELKKEVPSDSVFVPGISADLNVGAFITKYPQIYLSGATKDQLVDLIIEYSYSLFSDYGRFKKSSSCRTRIEKRLERYYRPGFEGRAFEAWVATEKVAKFVENSVRAYEFWGYEWWTPFWDAEFVEFWLGVEHTERIKQKLYKEYLKVLTAVCGGIGFENPLYRDGFDDGANNCKFRKLIKKMLPASLKTKIVNLLLPFTYERHQFQWYTPFERRVIFRKSLLGASSINSFYVDKYLDSLKIKFPR